MQSIARNNHFLPQWYLKSWSTDAKSVRVYNLLVPHEAFPTWNDQPIQKAASRRDLYTGLDGETDVDAFEEWMTREFEHPALAAFRKAIDDQPLSLDDKNRLAIFFALQDLRTPSSFLDFLERWQQTIPEIIDETLKKSIRKLEDAAERGTKLTPADSPAQEFAQPFRVTSRPAPDDTGQGALKAEVVMGRGLWLNSMQRLLTGVANHLKEHAWSIVSPFGNSKWFTSDHPALKLNYYGEGRYDFKGGWGNDGTELMLPLSPRHLLYAKVGYDTAPSGTMTRDETFHVQKFLAERAHRQIIARSDHRRATWFRPRLVDADMFKAEQLEWEQ